jgi:hypothetical protein
MGRVQPFSPDASVRVLGRLDEVLLPQNRGDGVLLSNDIKGVTLLSSLRQRRDKPKTLGNELLIEPLSLHRSRDLSSGAAAGFPDLDSSG